MANGRMRVSGIFRSSLVNEKSRVSALTQKSVRTIELADLMFNTLKSRRYSANLKDNVEDGGT